MHTLPHARLILRTCVEGGKVEVSLGTCVVRSTQRRRYRIGTVDTESSSSKHVETARSILKPRCAQ
jgi:hypothetical protein